MRFFPAGFRLRLFESVGEWCAMYYPVALLPPGGIEPGTHISHDRTAYDYRGNAHDIFHPTRCGAFAYFTHKTEGDLYALPLDSDLDVSTPKKVTQHLSAFRRSRMLKRGRNAAPSPTNMAYTPRPPPKLRNKAAAHSSNSEWFGAAAPATRA